MVKQQYNVVATAIIKKGAKYLIAKRSLDEEKFPGIWTVPGGTFEYKDYADILPNTQGVRYNVIEAAIKREVKEEVGIKIKNIQYLISMLYEKKSGPTICLSFFADYDKGDVVLDDELISFAWITAEELNKYELISGIPEEILMTDDIINKRKVKSWKEYEDLVK